MTDASTTNQAVIFSSVTYINACKWYSGSWIYYWGFIAASSFLILYSSFFSISHPPHRVPFPFSILPLTLPNQIKNILYLLERAKGNEIFMWVFSLAITTTTTTTVVKGLLEVVTVVVVVVGGYMVTGTWRWGSKCKKNADGVTTV